jgi:hypothetical protein
LTSEGASLEDAKCLRNKFVNANRKIVMLAQRILALLTGAFVALSLGLGLVVMALSPGKNGVEGESQEARLKEADPPSAPNVPTVDRTRAREAVEKSIADTPEYTRFFNRLREKFPGDYEGALNGFAARLTNPEQAESADLYVSETVRQLRQAHGVLAAKADIEPLGKVFDLQLNVLRAIAKEDARLCVAFLYGATNQDFQRFASTRRALVADMALAGLEAIINGQEKKIERPAPNEADFKVLESALSERGLGKVEIDALLDGKMPNPPLDDARMCAAGQTYLDVLRGLPEPVRLRIYGLAVELMARS